VITSKKNNTLYATYRVLFFLLREIFSLNFLTLRTIKERISMNYQMSPAPTPFGGEMIRAAIVIAVLLLLLSPSIAMGQNIVDEWQSVKAPSAPEMKSVSLDPKTTALLMLDFNHQTCNAERRPRCIASLPKVKQLLAEARSHGASVIYSLSAGASATDVAAEVAPLPGDPTVTSGPDKFLGTELEEILKKKGIKSVVVVGTAAHGAVLYTASGAALRGMKVIIPVEGLSADNLYAEQYTVWHLANAPRVSGQVAITKGELIKW
jgi:nicotinamidase-related amidase